MRAPARAWLEIRWSRLPKGQYWCYLRIVKPLPFAWPYALVFWGVYIWAFLPEWKVVSGGIEGAKREESKDGGSIRVIVAGMWTALLVAFSLAFVRAWMFPQRLQLPLFAIGISTILLGSLLRRYCWRTLGEYFTGDVRVRADQPVIDSGPYRYVRHPSYTAGMMMFIGIGLALGSWFSLALLTIATIATYVFRVTVEERALLDTIGEPYRVYCETRKRFVPYIV